jgi:hypothetical protein
MQAGDYIEYLEAMSETTGLPKSRLNPVQVTTILELEERLGCPLPEDYETFLLQIGVGLEHGGLAEWLSLDVDDPDNILERSKRIEKERHARDFLVIYDARDGDLYGFRRKGRHLLDKAVWSWNSESGELSRVADDFASFLDYLTAADARETGLVEARSLDPASGREAERAAGDHLVGNALQGGDDRDPELR